jgi:hypothetical protein
MFCSNHIANNITLVKLSEVLTIFSGIFSSGFSMEGSDKMVCVFFTAGNAARLAGFTSSVSQLLQEFYSTVLSQHTGREI